MKAFWILLSMIVIVMLLASGTAPGETWSQSTDTDFGAGETIGTVISDGSVELDMAPVLNWMNTSAINSDVYGRMVSTAGDVNGDGCDDLMAYRSSDGGTVDLYYGDFSSLSGSPDWSYSGGSGAGFFGLSMDGGGDVNGDGYDDILIGDYGNDSVATDAGMVHVFYGSASGIQIDNRWNATGNGTKDDRFGSSVSFAGDVNGDGYDDILVGEPRFGEVGDNEGRTYLFLGSATGPSATWDWNTTGGYALAQYGGSVSGSGDVNGDGYDDVVIGASRNRSNRGCVHVFLGSASGLSTDPAIIIDGEESGQVFGSTVAGVGDVNGDGYDDILVGVPYNDEVHPNGGKINVYPGSIDGIRMEPLWTVHGRFESDILGASNIRATGDLNQDGYDDLLIGSPNDDSNDGVGTVYLFLGSSLGPTPGPVWSMGGESSGDRFGYAVSGVGDIDGDGFPGFLISADMSDEKDGNAGKVYHYEMSDVEIDSISQFWYFNATVGDDRRFADEVKVIGDVNADGYSDVAVAHANYGWVHVYHGSPSGPSPIPDWSKSGNSTGEAYGSGIGAGDVNGDGYFDLIVGALANDENGSWGGMAYVYLGSDQGLETTAHWNVSGAPSSELGRSVAGGDINGDGYDDILIGASGNNSNRGVTYLFYGGPNRPAKIADWKREGSSTSDKHGYLVTVVGDRDADGYEDFLVSNDAYNSYSGIVWQYFGSETSVDESSSRTGESSGDQYGVSMSGIGDVNGDGYDDIAIGAPYNDSGGISAGKVYITYGGLLSPSLEPDRTIQGGLGDRLGGAVSGGDINGDGFDDLAVGHQTSDSDPVLIYFGSEDGVRTYPDVRITPGFRSRMFGGQLACGDVTNDGIDEIINGDPRAGNPARGRVTGHGLPLRLHYGYYISGIFNIDDKSVVWDRVDWDPGSVPDGTDVAFQIGVSDDATHWTFYGPDGTDGTWFSGASIDVPGGARGEYWRYRMRLEGLSAVSPVVDSVSVHYSTYEEPDVMLGSPNGGEDLMEGGSHIVTWSTTGDVEPVVALHYSTDGGTSWQEIAAETSDTGHYNWSVPSVETATGLVRVTAYGMDGTMVMDVSDMTFAIDPPANWQLPGSGSGDGTGDGTGGGDQTGTPDRTISSDDKAEVGALWIAIAVEGIAIAVLSIILIVLVIRKMEFKRRRKR